jgi:hypothetical protein
MDPAALGPLIARIVQETVRQLERDRAAMPEKVYSEPEAAAWLGVGPHVLRDERLRGRITASIIVGRRIRYQHSDLVRYLTERRVNGNREGH